MVLAVRRQVGRVLAAVVVAGAVVSGCGSPVQAGSAAIVGSDTVPLERVQNELAAVLGRTELVDQVSAQGGGPPDIARDIVTHVVVHDLLRREAGGAGIVVTDAAVDAEIADRGGVEALLATTFADLPGLRERVRDDLTAVQLAQRSLTGLSVTADIVAVTSREQAQQRATVLAAGGPGADALFAANPRTSRRDTVYQAATSPDVASSVLFGVPVGTVGFFQPDSQQSAWLVFRVTDRRTDTPPDPEAASQLSQKDLVAIGERMLQPVADELGVRVNPRYGVWDPIRLRVVPEDLTGGAILAPAASG